MIAKYDETNSYYILHHFKDLMYLRYNIYIGHWIKIKGNIILKVRAYNSRYQ